MLSKVNFMVVTVSSLQLKSDEIENLFIDGISGRGGGSLAHLLFEYASMYRCKGEATIVS